MPVRERLCEPSPVRFTLSRWRARAYPWRWAPFQIAEPLLTNTREVSAKRDDRKSRGPLVGIGFVNPESEPTSPGAEAPLVHRISYGALFARSRHSDQL
jgi:hypothetical protein